MESGEMPDFNLTEGLPLENSNPENTRGDRDLSQSLPHENHAPYEK